MEEKQLLSFENRLKGVIDDLVYDITLNSITNRLLITTDRKVMEYDCIEQKENWSFHFTNHFSKEYLNAPWSTKTVQAYPIIFLDMWMILFNQKFLFLIGEDHFYSNLMNLESVMFDFQFLNRSLEICCLKEDKKQFKFWQLDIGDIVSQRAKFQK